MNYVKHMDESDHYSISLEKWQELEGIHIPENVLKKYKAEKVKSMTEGIKKLKIEVEKAESELESLAQHNPQSNQYVIR